MLHLLCASPAVRHALPSVKELQSRNSKVSAPLPPSIPSASLLFPILHSLTSNGWKMLAIDGRSCCCPFLFRSLFLCSIKRIDRVFARVAASITIPCLAVFCITRHRTGCARARFTRQERSGTKRPPLSSVKPGRAGVHSPALVIVVLSLENHLSLEIESPPLPDPNQSADQEPLWNKPTPPCAQGRRQPGGRRELHPLLPA
jgi:hypothetical protein